MSSTRSCRRSLAVRKSFSFSMKRCCRDVAIAASSPLSRSRKQEDQRALWVFDDRVPVPGHEHADAGVVTVVGGDQVAARMPHHHLVVRSRDENPVDTALVAALAEKLARLVLEPGIREAADAHVNGADEEGVHHGPIRRGQPRSRMPDRSFGILRLKQDKNNETGTSRQKSYDIFSRYVNRENFEALELPHQPHPGASLHRA